MPNRLILTACLWLTTLLGLFAQDYELRGTVRDKDDASIAFATVYLYQAADTTLLRTEVADEEGVFRFPDIPPQLYFLRASYVQSYSSFTAIEVSGDTNMGVLKIRMQDNVLEEVVVVGTQPTIRREAGKVLFKVENTVLSSGTTADILARAPGVIEQSGAFYLRGQPAEVYLNGRPIPLSSSETQDLLQGLSGVNIQSVEVIANPSAQYSAEAGAILNVITSKNVTPGYKGSVQISQQQALVPKYQFGMSHYLKSKRWNFFLNYTFSPRNLLNTYDANTLFTPDAQPRQLWRLEGEQKQRRRTSNLNGLVQFELGDKSSLEYAVNLQLDPARTSSSEYTNDITDPDNPGIGLLSGFSTLNSTDGEIRNFSNDLGYKYQGDKTGITWNTNLTRYYSDDLQLLRTVNFDESRESTSVVDFETLSDQEIDIFSSQIDLNQSLGESSLQAGARFSYVGSDNSIEYSGFNGSSPVADAADSDDFAYLERVYALYANYLQAGWDQWSFTAGLRMEHTNSEGFSALLGETARYKFTELFPSLQLLYQPGDDYSMSFDYRRGIDRPNYRDLNPFRYFFTEVNFIEGNPQLRPNFSHNFNLNFTLQDRYYVDFYYRDNGRYISELVFQENDTFILREQNQNLLGSRSYGIDFTVSRSLKNWWYLYAYASLFHEEETFIAEESGGVEFTNEFDGFYLSLTNYLTLSRDGTWTGELGFTYLSGLISGSYVDDASNNLTVGLRKELWDNRAVFSIAAEDLLNGANFRTRSVYLNQNNDYLFRRERQFVRFGFTYNFGNFRLRERSKQIESSEIDRLESE